jgi:hypothetical protein
MGYVEDREHVVGFEPHRFTKMPGASAAPLKTEWRLVRLELIGLLRHERPKAYVSAHLPRLDELKDAATRDLDAVEQTALNRLEKDEDIVIDETPDRVRMVGSLRAGNDCVACHDAPRGKLLGALTYELVPIRRRANEQPARAL